VRGNSARELQSEAEEYIAERQSSAGRDNAIPKRVMQRL